MKLGKLWMAAILGVMPSMVSAQPRAAFDVRVDLDTYDTDAPGDPVASVNVFYDQLSPYGVWVDEPDVGRVFVPAEASFVPYTVGHWENTRVGFVWVSSEPHAWATTHYGRWAFSNYYGRWYWMPDTQWGPAWVEWRQTGADFGWAPLAPEIVIRAGWQPPIETWHYCPAERVLEPNVVRYYEPRERVVVIHREAKPIEHYSTISRVRVNVGPPAAVLREHHVVAARVKVEPRTVGRWTPNEVHAQVAHAEQHKATFEVQNQQRIEADAKIHAAHTKVIETHPQIKAQVVTRVAPKAEPKPEHIAPKAEPKPEHVAPKPPVEHAPARPEPRPEHVAPKAPPVEHAPAKPEPRPEHVAPKAPPVEHAPAKPEPKPEHVAPKAPPVERAPAPKQEQPRPAPKQEQPRPAPKQEPKKDEPHH